MELAVILFREVGVMFVIVACGFVLAKREILTIPMAKGFCNLLLVLVLPIMLIRMLQQEKTPALMRGFWVSLALSFAFQILVILVITLLIRNRSGALDQVRVERMGVVFSNCGFMGFPLLYAAIGEVGLLYGVAFNVAFNVLAWTWGVALFTGRENVKARDLILNPGIIGVVVGVALFVLGVRLPVFVMTFADHMYNINTPLAMLATGVFLAQVKPVSIVNNPHIYKVVFLRNLVMPALLIALLYAARAGQWFAGSKEMSMSVVICAGCASAMSSFQFPARFGGDSLHGARIVAASTVAGVATLPLMAAMAEALL